MDCEAWGLFMFIGGGSRIYFGEKAGNTENFSARARKSRVFVVQLGWVTLRSEGRAVVGKGGRRERICVCWGIFIWGYWAGS